MASVSFEFSHDMQITYLLLHSPGMFTINLGNLPSADDVYNSLYTYIEFLENVKKGNTATLSDFGEYWGLSCNKNVVELYVWISANNPCEITLDRHVFTDSFQKYINTVKEHSHLYPF